MASNRIGIAFNALARRSFTCQVCQHQLKQLQRRAFTQTALRAAGVEKPGSGASLDPKSEVKGAPIEAPRSYGKRIDGEFTPKPLPRPIGMPLPPNPGENTGLDHRTLKQRREDFVDWDKHLARRKELYDPISSLSSSE